MKKHYKISHKNKLCKSQAHSFDSDFFNILAYDSDGLSVIRENTQHELKKYNIKDRLWYPEEFSPYFDIAESLHQNLYDFGVATTYENYGKTYRYRGYKKTLIKDGKCYNVENLVGIVVLEAHNRFVLLTKFGYFGWIKKDNCEFVSMPTNDIQFKH